LSPDIGEFLLLLVAEDLLHERNVRAVNYLPVDEKKRRTDACYPYPVPDLLVGLQEFVRLIILAGCEFHVVEFSGHRLLIGQRPVFGAENIKYLCLGVWMDRGERVEEDMPCHVISFRKKLGGRPAERAVRIGDFDHRVGTTADLQGLFEWDVLELPSLDLDSSFLRQIFPIRGYDRPGEDILRPRGVIADLAGDDNFVDSGDRGGGNAVQSVFGETLPEGFFRRGSLKRGAGNYDHQDAEG